MEFKIPHEIADKMKSGEIEFTSHWGQVMFQHKGQNMTLDGEIVDVDYQHAESHHWEEDAEQRRLEAWEKHLTKKQGRVTFMEPQPNCRLEISEIETTPEQLELKELLDELERLKK